MITLRRNIEERNEIGGDSDIPFCVVFGHRGERWGKGEVNDRKC